MQEIYSLVRFARKTKILVIGGIDFIYLENENKVLNLTFIIRPFKVLKGEKEYKDAEMILLPKLYPSPIEYEIFQEVALIVAKIGKFIFPTYLIGKISV